MVTEFDWAQVETRVDTKQAIDIIAIEKQKNITSNILKQLSLNEYILHEGCVPEDIKLAYMGSSNQNE